MDIYENIRCLACQEEIPLGQDTPVTVDFDAPGEEPQQMIVAVCWYCANEMSNPTSRVAIEAIINARVTRLKNDDDDKSYKP